MQIRPHIALTGNSLDDLVSDEKMEHYFRYRSERSIYKQIALCVAFGTERHDVH
jgi:hypothetical protein